MLKYYSRQLRILLRLIDILVALASFQAAYYAMYGLTLPDMSEPGRPHMVFLILYLAFWVYLSQRMKLYDSKRMSGLRRELAVLLETTVVGAMLAFALASLLQANAVSGPLEIMFWTIDTSAMATLRLCARSFLKYIRRRGYNYRQIIIAGRNGRSEEFVRKIESSPELGYRILGFLDARGMEEGSPVSSRYELLGELKEVEGVLRELVVDEVYIFLPVKSFYAEIERILSVCENVGVEVKISTEIFTHKIAKSTITYCGEVPLIDLFSSPVMNWQLIVKRLMDIAVSGVFLVFFMPLLLTVAALIKSTSAGPVIFRQKRKGYNGRTFNCYKFRTMIDGAENLKDGLLDRNEMDGPVFKIKSDPRVTAVGRILRKTSIDEIPQLVNVLKGDMSLVGPRPPLPEEVRKYDLPYLRRLSMKPGITCLWQVNGRNSIPFTKWMELDRQYIEHWSLALDFVILFKTIPAVLRGSGER